MNRIQTQNGTDGFESCLVWGRNLGDEEKRAQKCLRMTGMHGVQLECPPRSEGD